MSPLETFPVFGSIGGVPETNTNPFALIAGLSGTPAAFKASEIPATWIASRSISVSFPSGMA